MGNEIEVAQSWVVTCGGSMWGSALEEVFCILAGAAWLLVGSFLDVLGIMAG